MTFFENLKRIFRNGDSLIKLIYLNSAIFLVVKLIDILFLLFNSSGSFISSYLAVPSNLPMLAIRFWTPLSYMFYHEDVLHILFNMIALYWFGKLFLMYFSEKQLVGLYLFGGINGALFYLLAYNIFPFYASMLHGSFLLGASGSIMAVMLAVAFRSPNLEMQMLFIGRVKLIYIAIVYVLVSLFGITSSNGGGQLAHLGGAFAGYIFVVSLRRGTDLTKVFTLILDALSNLFKPRRLKVKKTGYASMKMTDTEFNANKAKKMEEIDRILDKIKSSGYESLSANEKKRLFDQGNK
ncbi:MAG: rhomboid family intramembrane serine protease [Paludibacter sp.]